MLSHCLLSWAGQRAPICPIYTMCRSLGYHIVPTSAASFLSYTFPALVASFVAIFMLPENFKVREERALPCHCYRNEKKGP